MAKRDYYEVLGVSKSATVEEIRRAHRKLVRQHHPDVNKNNKSSEEKFKEVQEAYDVLSDEQKRKEYDQFGHAGPNGGDPFGGFPRNPAGGRGNWNAGGASVQDFDPKDFSNAGDFGDIFEQFFGRGAGGGGARTQSRGGRARGHAEPVAPARGADIEHAVTLNFDQAARGVNLPLQINRDGRLETIDIKIPAGVKDGSKVRLKGKGQHVHGGEAGDLYIVTSVRPHEQFRRDELDILIDVPVSVYDAMLGTKANVQTLDGPVTITIPPGTSSGAKLRIKGRGVFRGDEKGDQLCVIKIIVPKDLDEEDKEVIRTLQAKRPVVL
ncbi:DnaJ C-terminal domain-containing protein [Humisphaera borealis]|uniref:DnaJ domain-containing protein n=1 Tax=Humisphaera borealis TaxID=2807512 RepID=A0A7M2X050_9BACT|nr:DnaJ C-terminal domain-containing protein [Humisphaera borealis]QOV91126.1 DnaJ domain-containing protein [Humisphaera borealis]